MAVAHHRIGGGAPALAENAPTAGEADNVVHGEKVELVGQLLDQRQLGVDHGLDVVGNAIRPAYLLAGLHQAGEVGDGRQPRRHQFLGILVTELEHGEVAQVGNYTGLRQQCRRVELGQLAGGFQVGLAVGVQGGAHGLHRRIVIDGGEHILQYLALPAVHQCLATGHQG